MLIYRMLIPKRLLHYMSLRFHRFHFSFARPHLSLSPVDPTAQVSRHIATLSRCSTPILRYFRFDRYCHFNTLPILCLKTEPPSSVFIIALFIRPLLISFSYFLHPFNHQPAPFCPGVTPRATTPISSFAFLLSEPAMPDIHEQAPARCPLILPLRYRYYIIFAAIIVTHYFLPPLILLISPLPVFRPVIASFHFATPPRTRRHSYWLSSAGRHATIAATPPHASCRRYSPHQPYAPRHHFI